MWHSSAVPTHTNAPVQTGPGTHTASNKMDTGPFPGYRGRGVALTTHVHLRPKLKKVSTATPVLPLWALMAGDTVNCIPLPLTCYGSSTHTHTHNPNTTTEGTLASTDMATRERQCRRRRRPRGLFKDNRCNRYVINSGHSLVYCCYMFRHF